MYETDIASSRTYFLDFDGNSKNIIKMPISQYKSTFCHKCKLLAGKIINSLIVQLRNNISLIEKLKNEGHFFDPTLRSQTNLINSMKT